MKRTDAYFEGLLHDAGIERHPDCKLVYMEMTGEYDCGFQTLLTCEECKYGFGRKDPAAKCNR